MAIVLGDKRGFGVEIGEWVDPLLRRVDLWAADQWLTCDDNLAFVMQFRMSVAATARWMRSGGGLPVPFADLSPIAAHRRLLGEHRDREENYERYRFLTWGPTTDNLLACLFREKDRLAITFEFWREEHLLEHPEHRGTVFAAELRTGEFLAILEESAEVVGQDQV